MKRRVGSRAGLVAAALSMAGGVVAAQTMGQGFRAIGLVNEDWSAMIEAGRTLYEPEVAELGAEAPWVGGNGVQGVVRLISTEPGEDGRPCVVLRTIASPPEKDELSVDARRCQDATGKWLLAARP